MIAGVQQEESECEKLADSENGSYLQANEEREGVRERRRRRKKIDNTSVSAHFTSKCCFMRNFQ